jgi:peptide deformylase
MRTLRYYGDPVLRRRAKEAPPDDRVRGLAADLLRIMRDHGGVGLAAPQVGESVRLIVVDPSAGKDPAQVLTFLNPRLTLAGGSHTDEEGCLSLPGLRLPVRRRLEARVEAQDLDGRPISRETRGLLARIVQHETDHLDGILITDRQPLWKRVALVPTLLRLRRDCRRLRRAGPQATR